MSDWEIRAKEPFADPTRLTKWTVGFLLAFAAISVVAVAGDIITRELLLKVGAHVQVVDSAKPIAGADAVVLPGVGAFDDCMNALQRQELVAAVSEFIRTGRPFLGICVGYQALFDKSEEFNSQAGGFGVFQGRVVRFPDGNGLKVPQIGWNRVDVQRSVLFDGIENGTPFYFVHSYAATHVDSEIGRAHYGGPFTAAAQDGRVFGLQFHPEKSSVAGLRVLRNFVELRT